MKGSFRCKCGLASMLQGRRRARLLSPGLVRTVELSMFTCITVWQNSVVQLQAGLFAITSYRMVSPKGGAALARSELEPLDSKYRPAFCSATKSCLTLCNPMDFSTAGSPVLHHLPEFAQTHVHRVGDAIQLSHLLSPPSPPALSISQHQGLFQWVESSCQVAKVLELLIYHQSFQWIFRVDFF